MFFSQFPSLRWPRPRFFGDANRRGFQSCFGNYVSHCRDFIQFRKVAGRSGSKKVRFFLHCFSRKMGIQTVIDVVLGTLFSFGCDACFFDIFLLFFSYFGKENERTKKRNFSIFCGPIFDDFEEHFFVFS